MTNAELDQQILDIEEPPGRVVLQAVYDFLGRFVSYPSEHAQTAHGLWCVHTHLMHLWESTPRLAFLSPEPASGKTRAMEITNLLVPNPVLAVNVSPTYLFRKVGAGAVTLLYDEIDAVFGPKAKDNEDTRALLNAGHRRGAVAGRCVARGTTVATEEISAFAPLAVAGLGWLPDTLMSRAIVIRMRPRHTGEEIESYRARLHDKQGAAVYRLIETWAATQTEVTWPELPKEIQDRDADCWEPLIVIAEAVGGRWPKAAREAAVSLVSAAQDREASLGIRLLHDTQIIFGDSHALHTRVLLHQLIALEESPWGDIRGKPLDERGLAHRLRQYSIRSRQIRTGDITLKGYLREDFLDAWKRYPPPRPQKPETNETSKTSVQNQRPNVSDDVSDSGNVSDTSLGVSDDVLDNSLENTNKLNIVSDVSVVPHLPPNGAEPCAPALAIDDYLGPPGDDPTDFLDGYPDMPEFLRRCSSNAGNC